MAKFMDVIEAGAPAASGEERAAVTQKRAGPGIARQDKAASGWWFGSEVGAGQTWARNPEMTEVPPLRGWRCPSDGPVQEHVICRKPVVAPSPHVAWLRPKVKEEGIVKEEAPGGPGLADAGAVGGEARKRRISLAAASCGPGRATQAATAWGDAVDLSSSAARLPELEAPRNGFWMSPGEVFQVCDERCDADDGITYLKLADGRGWVFDYRPGVGLMCSPKLDDEDDPAPAMKRNAVMAKKEEEEVERTTDAVARIGLEAEDALKASRAARAAGRGAAGDEALAEAVRRLLAARSLGLERALALLAGSRAAGGGAGPLSFEDEEAILSDGLRTLLGCVRDELLLWGGPADAAPPEEGAGRASEAAAASEAGHAAAAGAAAPLLPCKEEPHQDGAATNFGGERGLQRWAERVHALAGGPRHQVRGMYTLAADFTSPLRSVLDHLVVRVPASDSGGDAALLQHCRDFVRGRILEGHAAGILDEIDWDDEPLPAPLAPAAARKRSKDVQAALSAKSGVIGVAAEIAGGALREAIAGVAVRLFKYVLNDYYEEFCTQVHDWVSAKLRVVPHADQDEGGRLQVQVLREVYTSHVIPDEMLALWNCGTWRLVHAVAPGVDDVAARPGLLRRFVDFLVRTLLRPESHPTLTRFFTFRGVVDQMLTMHFVDMPKNAFVLLRRASMVLQLTGGVEALTCAEPKPGALPTVVVLAKGAAHEVVNERLQRLLSTMCKDQELDAGAAAGVLFGTAVDLIVRFDVFKAYPFQLCYLCRAWFPQTYTTHILRLLHGPAGKLDVGVTFQLYSLAWATGDEMSAIRWFASEPVQDFLQRTCQEALATSLPAERRHAEAKRWETSKVTNIATQFGRVGDSDPDEDDTAARRLAYIEEHADELESQRAALVAAAEREYESLLLACRVPLTRAQWAQWLDENMEQFAEKMQSAPGRRRARNHRLRARPGLPLPAARVGPEVDQWKPCETQWGVILERRSGWHGIHVRPNRKHMFFLYTLAGRTYAIDMEPFLTGAVLTYNILEDFDVAAAILPLAVLEDAYTDADVLGVFRFRVRGGPAPGGGFLLAAEAPEGDEEAGDGAGLETCPKDLGLDGDGGSSEDDLPGLSDSSRVVDTDADSTPEGSSVGSDSASESGGEPAGSDAPLAVDLEDLPGLGSEEVAGGRRPPLWDNGFFYIPDNTGNPDVKIVMHEGWSHPPPGGMGDKNRSKTLTPAHYGESRDDPVRSVIVLRCWMLWRAGSNGWSAAHPGRARDFAEEAGRLQREIQDLQPLAGGLLGHPRADARLREWVPDIVAQL
ncbi:unnamed protein product [Prorocentrum cordatum]|uniref:Uncharacterized protein n=1 Tax=Prorocentrum cordatum TaxID=2364126 RepID=A0ABN9VDD7_9DINO|nr:unnamed protein product [Polarella glacialis]